MLWGCASLLLLLLAASATAVRVDPADATYHVLALPHTVVRDDFSACAYTMKVKRMCRMLRSLGYYAILYANAGSADECTHMETIFSDEEREAAYGADAEWRSGARFFRFDNTGLRLLVSEFRPVQGRGADPAGRLPALPAVGIYRRRAADGSVSAHGGQYR